MMENRSFDHYSAASVGTRAARTSRRRRGDKLCFANTDHSWKGSHGEYDDGKNDGFFATNDITRAIRSASATARCGGYDEQEIPFYYALAKSFALGDHYHSALLGETWPNRAFLVAATSLGTDLSSCPYPACDSVVFDELDKRHVDFGLFTSRGPPGTTIVVGPLIATRWARSVTGTIEDFEAAAASATLRTARTSTRRVTSRSVRSSLRAS